MYFRIQVNCTEATEIHPIHGGNYYTWGLSLPTVALISGPIWHMSTNPDCLLKVKVIAVNIVVNRMARWLGKKVTKCAEGEALWPEGHVEWFNPWELLLQPQYRLVSVHVRICVCMLMCMHVCKYKKNRNKIIINKSRCQAMKFWSACYIWQNIDLMFNLMGGS